MKDKNFNAMGVDGSFVPTTSVTISATRQMPEPVSVKTEQALVSAAANADAAVSLFNSRVAFSIAEVALLLNVSEKTVRRLIDRKLLKASKALRHLRVSKWELQRFLAET
jgi:excisionase family DNA binding protein